MSWINTTGIGMNTSKGKIYKIMDIDVETKKKIIVFHDSDAWFTIYRLRDQTIIGDCIIGLNFFEHIMMNSIAKKSLESKQFFVDYLAKLF